jgi:ADP-ribose pyrophosphatase YjhB (NUDIX family)
MKKIICSDIDGNIHEVEASKLSYRPSVYGIIIQDDKILLVPQFDGYDFPGGGMKIHETLEEALKREVKEETGLDILQDQIVACEHSFFLLPNVNIPVSSILIFYVCKVVDGEITDAYFDEYEKKYAKKAEWISLNKLGEIKYINSVNSLEIIHKALKLL